jgi:thiol:disulfide interchange protein DsbD
MRVLLASGVLLLSTAAPGVLLAADLSLLGATVSSAAATECKETPATEGTAADLAIKARLLLALCRDNQVTAGALAFVAGLLTSLSPCVYPLIPITISIFGARQATSRVRAFALSASYVAGMSTLYTALGVTFASLGLLSGGLMAIPAVVIGIGLLCLAMAASMFGAFEIALPVGVQTRLSQVGGAGMRGAFLMGLAAGVIAAPCTGPVLAVILSLISKSGEPGKGAMLMGFYSLGMGMLFLVLGTFSSFLASIPKSGRWMETVKSVLGLSMLGAAAYLVKPHFKGLGELTSSLATLPNVALLALVLLAISIPVGALHLSFKDEGVVPRARKGFGLVMSTAAVLMLLGWMDAAPPTPVTSETITWLREHDTALAQARAQGKPLMIDFGADWCAACKELEHVTYKDPAFVKEAQRFVTVLVDATEETETIKSLFMKYGITGLPVVVFYGSDGKVLTDPRVEGFVAANDFVKEMQRVK